MAEILGKFNGPNAKYKINISIGSLGGDADLARTSNSGIPRTYNIVFNENYPNATSLSKATSLIHEYIHAYFNTLYDDWKNNGNIHAYDEYPPLKAFYIDGTYSSPYSKDAHHDAIASSFINLMAATIQEYNTNMPVAVGAADQFYIDMAWSSLQGTPAYNNSNLTEEAKDRIGSQRAVETYNKPRGIYPVVGTPCNN
ncbi:hypothetical protein [Flavobacterium chungangense]|uniref:hypothetical protein n=1 Tax=Flavobacterium chungangense TaxID=554283 RepID=UPI0014289DCB|nr:hypothetical protein [Flavobacterium chungangense]